MGTYKDIVTAIKKYNLDCLAAADSDCLIYDMKWNVDVGLEHPIDGNEWWTANIQFVTWGNYRQGVIFYKQIGDSRNETTPTSAVIDEFVKFFEYPDRRNLGSGSGSGSTI